MDLSERASARKEWAQMWPLPFVAMLGLVGSGLFTFSTGVFMDEVVKEFGWTKTQFTSSMLMPMIVMLIGLPFVGRMIDRIGPRKVVLRGIIPSVIGTSMLCLANGEIWQWFLLCFIQALGVITVTPPVWITAVVGRFHASRGLSLAVVLAGTGAGTAVWPVLGAYYIEWFGWRMAYPALAVTWGALMLPLALAFFRGAKDISAASARKPAAPPFAHLLKTKEFLCLAASGAVFILITYGLILHLVPILRAEGFSLTVAASLAGVAGITSVAGRIGAGFLLDFVPTRPFGVIIFLTPILVSVLLMFAGGSFPLLLLAAVLLGLAMGAEGDILTYIASRRFDHAVFGSVYAIIQAVFAVASVSGSIFAGMLFDGSGSYTSFLMALIPLTLVGAVLIGMVPEAGHEDAHL